MREPSPRRGRHFQSRTHDCWGGSKPLRGRRPPERGEHWRPAPPQVRVGTAGRRGAPPAGGQGRRQDAVRGQLAAEWPPHGSAAGLGQPGLCVVPGRAGDRRRGQRSEQRSQVRPGVPTDDRTEAQGPACSRPHGPATAVGEAPGRARDPVHFWPRPSGGPVKRGLPRSRASVQDLPHSPCCSRRRRFSQNGTQEAAVQPTLSKLR